MNNSLGKSNYFDSLPQILKEILFSRPDLITLKYNTYEQQDEFLIWIISNGIKEYPDLFVQKDNKYLFKWFSQKVIFRDNTYLPRIVYALWNTNLSQRRRWAFPSNDKSYFLWLKNTWNDNYPELPTFNNFYFEISTQNKYIYFINIFIFAFRLLFNKKIINTNKYPNKNLKYFKKGFKIQGSVISALVYRELKTRISQVRFGIFGVFIEPLGVFSVFLIIFTFIRGRRSTLGIDTELFLISGIIIFSLFSDVAIRSINGMQANEALFFYRPVKPIDTVIARTIVETGLYSIVFIVITGGIFLFLEKFTLDNLPLLFITFISLSLTASGIGLLIMVAGFRYSWLYQFVPLLMRPLWFISGVFFSVSTLPASIRPWLSWNPVLQAVELSRHAFSSNYYIDSTVISLTYLISFSIVSVSTGLWVYSNNEKILLTR